VALGASTITPPKVRVVGDSSARRLIVVLASQLYLNPIRVVDGAKVALFCAAVS
jgi:hypothetical protein